MEKIKFITDTACDIPDEDVLRYNIDMPSIPIAVDGEEYWERRSFGIKEFYKVLENSKEIPVTSRVSAEDFLDCYKKAYGEGYEDIICVTINAGGSGTNASAHTASDTFYSEIPEAADKMNIHIVDSKTYSVVYGYPVIQSAIMAEEGKSVAEILDYLDDWFRHAEIILGCFSLEYAKKSGRIGAATAFVGEVLGLRPIISMYDGKTKTIDKVRGDKTLIDRIVANCAKPGMDTSKDVLVICGAVEEYGLELQRKLKEAYGVDAPIYFAGASIAINAGLKIVAAVLLDRNRNN